MSERRKRYPTDGSAPIRMPSADARKMEIISRYGVSLSIIVAAAQRDGAGLHAAAARIDDDARKVSRGDTPPILIGGAPAV